ncbi:MAG: hypothetical protein QOI04_1457 [Verrucomicrobiota bacterium]|jgi:hypothetical protein
MKRFIVLVLIAAIAAVAIWAGLRSSRSTSSAAVSALLPKEALGFVHLPDFNRARDEWHRSDIYELWREPAMQEFLQKPLANSKRGETEEQLRDFEKLEARDIFIALTAWENSSPKWIGGFRFRGSADAVEKVIGQWRANFPRRWTQAKRETFTYQQHKIDIVTSNQATVATVYDGDWFFLAMNDVDELKAVLDRLDKRATGPALASDETFAAAYKHMPSSFAALLYLRADHFLERVMPSAMKAPGGAPDMSILRQMHSFCSAIAFDGGKMRDVLFVGMPKLAENGTLTRSSLVLGTKETFLYAAGFLNFKQMQWPATQTGAPGLAAWPEKFRDRLAAKGITLDDWDNAFGAEFGLLGDWPAGARWPAVLATLPVKDSARATKIVTAITMLDEDATWIHAQRDGVEYFTLQSWGSVFSFAPTIALSGRVLVAGADVASVEAAIKRAANSSSDLAATQNFQKAEGTVPTAKQAFAYVDLALLYTRLDAALRPMLLMATAFMPSINDNVDLSKYPPPEIITRHLSPIAMAQNYERDGYVTESVGPITFYQALGGGAGVGVAGAFAYRGGIAPLAQPAIRKAAPTPTPSATP